MYAFIIRLIAVSAIRLRVLMEKEELPVADKVKEEIRFNTEILRLVVVGILTIGGGTVSIISEGVFTGKRNFLIACGIFILIVLIRYLYKSYRTIKHLMK